MWHSSREQIDDTLGHIQVWDKAGEERRGEESRGEERRGTLHEAELSDSQTSLLHRHALTTAHAAGA